MLKKCDFQKFKKEKKIEKKNFGSQFFCKNCHEIAKNGLIDKAKTVLYRQDFCKFLGSAKL